MKKTLKSALLTVAAMLFAVSAFAQVTTSALSGKVTDKNGESVPGATVVAVHTPSGTQYFAVANLEGHYSINGMRAGGPYSVSVDCMGYRTITYTDINLKLADAATLNVTLDDDAEMLGEAIVVAVPASKFSNEKTGASTNISGSQIAALPTISRSITDVTRLSPYGGNGMSFAGVDGRTSNFTVDGANFNNNFGLSESLPGGGNPISIDAIEEMQVIVSPFDVRQTNFVGGGINAITKSGTNTFKGTAYVYHRNENLRGDTILGEQILTARDYDRNTNYGFTLGGPIVKNKLFFFVNAEYSQIPSVVTRWRASEDGVMDPDAQISRTTLADLKKVSDFVKEKYGYDTGSWTNYPANKSLLKLLGRIDWNINSSNRLAVRYNYTLNRNWIETNASSMDGGERSSFARFSKYGMAYANSLYSQDNLVSTISVDLNSRINDNLSNQFLATYTKADDARGSTSSDFPFIDIRNDDGTQVLPYIALGYELFTWNNGVHTTNITMKDDLTYFFNSHKLTAGIGYEYQMADNAYMRNGTGYYRYKSLDDFFNGAAPEVVGLTYGYDGDLNPASRVRFHKASAYVQDEWQVSENFKLTAGLRLDEMIFDNRDLRTNKAIYDLNYGTAHDAANPEAHVDGCRHIDTGYWPKPSLIVSPRIGFNWDVLGDKSLSLRGGTGLFAGRIPLVFFTNMPSNSGMVQYNAKISADYKGTTQMDMNNFAGGILNRNELYEKLVSLGFPSTIKPEDGTIPGDIAAVDPSFKMPQVWKTSLAVDYKLPTSFPFSITAEGIFNKTINGTVITDWSVLPTSGFARFNGADNRPIYDAQFKRQYVDAKGKTVDMPAAYVLENTHRGYGYSATFSINTTPVDGLNIVAAYTRTGNKEITGMPGSNASSVLNYMTTVYGPNDPGLHNSQYVVPDRFFTSLSYSDKSGNHFSLFYEAIHGGANYSYRTANDMNGDGYNFDAIFIPTDDQVANKEFRFVSQDDADRFLAYVHKDPYLSRNQGKYAEAYSLYAPWSHRLDFSYKHDFKVNIGKSVNVLQLSADIKNVLNIFNSGWGVMKQLNPELNAGQILKYEGIDAEGYPTFSTAAEYNANSEIFTPIHGIGQCWYASVGIKYLFN